MAKQAPMTFCQRDGMGLAYCLVRPFVIGIEWDWLDGCYDLLSEALNGIGWLARMTFLS
jgi:hypothetical protein